MPNMIGTLFVDIVSTIFFLFVKNYSRLVSKSWYFSGYLVYLKEDKSKTPEILYMIFSLD